MGECTDFIRGFSSGLAEYARAKTATSEHNQGKEP